MRLSLILSVLIAGGVGVSLWVSQSVQSQQPAGKAVGLTERVPWTTSKVIGSPEPPPPYKTVNAFTHLKFFEPLDMDYAKGSGRLFVAERKGKIFSFENRADADKADLVLDLGKKTIYALTFHPKFKDNRFMYVTYIPNPDKESEPNGTRVSRFTLSKDNPPKADPKSEKVIFEWQSGGHNGGCLKFGPDGYLYIVTGDGSGIADSLDIGQDLTSIFSKMLRIDVDNPADGKAYGIPRDNPFGKGKLPAKIGDDEKSKEVTKLIQNGLPEVYAYGLRQLWRFGFDRKTGECWGGEVGQDLWEMVYKIEKGGNYGWSVMEGNHPFRPERKKGPTPILSPVVEHSHTDFRSITGGFVYRGKRLPELEGHYIYGDFDTGRVWSFKMDTVPGGVSIKIDPNGEKVAAGTVSTVRPTKHGELARTTMRIVAWSEDEAGELYFVDFVGGGIHQIVKAPPVAANTNFPKKLSQTGIFASTKDNKVAAGVIPYSVNAQLWGDHAIKERFLAIPGDGKIGFDEITYPQPSPGAPPGWRFPDGTVLVKTFAMEMERGNPKSLKRLETRILHFQQFEGSQEIGDQYWRGYTYVWNDAQTDADLLDEKGLDKILKVKVEGKEVEQNYRFPSRAECTLCHNNAAKFALGVSTMQMNRDHNYGGVVANQLATLEHIGLFSKKLPAAPEKLPKLVDFHDPKASVEDKARSYLHSNCAHCHMKWGGGNAEFKLLSSLPLAEMGIVNVTPAHGNFGIQGAKLITPGDPEKSIIHKRVSMTGLGRMPHIGSRVVDDTAVKLLSDWIKGLK